MLYISQKYKPLLTKTLSDSVSKKSPREPDFTTSVMPSIQGKGINELIQKVKDMKIKDLNKKRNMNAKITFD